MARPGIASSVEHYCYPKIHVCLYRHEKDDDDYIFYPCYLVLCNNNMHVLSEYELRTKLENCYNITLDNKREKNISKFTPYLII